MSLVRVPTPGWMRGTTSQGVGRPQEELDMLPFEGRIISGEGEVIPGGVLLTGGAEAELFALPQRPFRGERLVMSAGRLFTPGAPSGVVITPAIYVGAVQIGASQGQTPVEAFAANAFGVRLSLPACGQGTRVSIRVRCTLSPLVEDAVGVSAVIFGRAVR